MIVWDLESELVFHGHNNLDVIQRVQAQVVGEVQLQGQLVCGDLVERFTHGQDPGLDVSLGQFGFGSIRPADKKLLCE